MILYHIDLGVDIISMRGYDLLQDAIDVGQQVIQGERSPAAHYFEETDDLSGRRAMLQVVQNVVVAVEHHGQPRADGSVGDSRHGGTRE